MICKALTALELILSNECRSPVQNAFLIPSKLKLVDYLLQKTDFGVLRCQKVLFRVLIKIVFFFGSSGPTKIRLLQRYEVLWDLDS